MALGVGDTAVAVGTVAVVVAFDFGREEGGRTGVEDRAGVAVDLVIVFAIEAVVAQREFVAGHQLAVARRAPEALDVVDLGFGAHHEVAPAEPHSALVTFGAEQPAPNDTSTVPFVIH